MLFELFIESKKKSFGEIGRNKTIKKKSAIEEFVSYIGDFWLFPQSQ